MFLPVKDFRSALRYFPELLVVLLITFSVRSVLAQDEHLRREINPVLTRIADEVVARVTVENAERLWLNQKHRVHIRVGQYAPFHFVSDNTPVGLSVDYVRVICAAWQIDCDFVICTDLTRALSSTGKANGLDLFTALHRSAEREKLLIFSRPYISSPYVIVSREDDVIHQLNDLKDRLIVLERGLISIDFMRVALPDIRIIEVDNTTQALSKVAAQEADAYVGARMVVEFLLKEIGLNNLHIARPAPFPPNTMSIAVRRDWPEFASLIDKSLAVMQDSEHQQIIEYWQPIDREALVLRKTAFRWAGILIMVTLFLTSIIWILRLRAEIHARQLVQETLEAERASLEMRVMLRTQALSIAKEAAERANNTKNQFLAIMSHELRTPLSGMLGLIRLLLNTELTYQQRQWLNAIQDAGQSELAQLSDILELSRIETGHLEIYPEVCDLHALIEVTAAIFSETAEEKGLTFTVQRAPRLPRFILIDPRRVRQILGNLLNNAIRFTDEGQITFNIESNHCQLCFSIIDTGIGIAPEALERIFEPFIQENTAISRNYGGTGLGLAICRRLATAMAGRVECHSQPGRGSTFRFEITLRTVEEPITASVMEHGIVSQLFILLVEDDALNRIATAALLETLGHRVVVAANGTQALEQYATAHFDLILADLHMPGMDGFEFVTTLRQRPAGIDVLIFALTADLTADTERRAATLFDAVLTKPFDDNEFYRALGNKLPGFFNSSAPSAAPINGAGLNREYLAQTLAALAPEKRDEWLQLAKNTLTTGLATIQRHAATGNWSVLATEAHRLVSAASIAGLIDLQNSVRELEQSVLAGQENTEITQLIAKIETLLPNALQLLDGVEKI